MVAGGFEALANWYDEKQGDEGDVWHRMLIDPPLLRLVGTVRGLRILDLACGNGYLSRRFAREGAASVLGVDASPGIVARAQAREAAKPTGVRFEVRDARNLEGIEDASVDLVVSNMALMDIPEADRVVREVGRVVRPGGRFVFSICHPCFDINDRSGWEVERIVYDQRIWRKVTRYREEVVQECPWRVSETELRYTKSYHRTLSTYVRYLYDAHLALSRLEEPAPEPGFVPLNPNQGTFIVEIPLHLVVEALRLGS